MKKVNLYFGLILLLIFLGTGYYLKTYFKPQHLNDLTLRMEIRANHIYILFVSLLNILSYKYETSKGNVTSSVGVVVFRTLLVAAGIASVWAFCVNHHGNLIGRKITLMTVSLSLAAVILFLVTEYARSYRKQSTTQRVGTNGNQEGWLHPTLFLRCDMCKPVQEYTKQED